jgi:uncharacterized lipoprotein YajG
MKKILFFIFALLFFAACNHSSTGVEADPSIKNLPLDQPPPLNCLASLNKVKKLNKVKQRM